jgi:hypothetical protein
MDKLFPEKYYHFNLNKWPTHKFYSQIRQSISALHTAKKFAAMQQEMDK